MQTDIQTDKSQWKVRVGTCLFSNKTRQDPSFPEFQTVVVLTKSASRWGEIGPYNLKDSKGRIMENIYQFSKIYTHVPAIKTRYAANSPIIAWEYPEETHVGLIDGKIIPNSLYFAWREKGQNNNIAVRSPVGWKCRHNCIGAYKDDDYDKLLNYVESRKEIYIPLYISLVKQHPLFDILKRKLIQGENILIAEQDGPHEESMPYYKAKYGVSDDFIINRSMDATPQNLKIMLEDEKHPFGHGYCLAMALLDIEL